MECYPNTSERLSLRMAAIILFLPQLLLLATWYLGIAEKWHSQMQNPISTGLKAKAIPMGYNFSYDRERWNQQPRKMVVLPGPHKAASTSIQAFLFEHIAMKVSASNSSQQKDISKYQGPKGDMGDWLFPYDMQELIKTFPSPTHNFFSRSKFHANYAKSCYRGGMGEDLEFFRSMTRNVLAAGQKVVLASEGFDRLESIVDCLPMESNVTKLLQLEDIEMVVHHRTPRSSHLTSLWHQVCKGGESTLRDFILTGRMNLQRIDGLRLVKNFLQNGLSTTLVDMNGVSEKDAAATEATNVAPERTNKTVVKGLEGTLVCDILLMGEDRNICDSNGWLYLDKDKVPEYANKRADIAKQDLSENQVEEMNRVMNEYDCGIWVHYIQPYQEKGLFRALYPSKNLFGTCDPKNSPYIEPEKLKEKIKKIANITEE